jgi:hypothetical protein
MHRRNLAPFALAAPVLIAFAPLVLAPGSLLVDTRRPSIDESRPPGIARPGNDLTRFLLPRLAATSDRGWPPLWDPSGFGGRPNVGNPQAGLFYPPAWLSRWSSSLSAPGWLTIAHLLWGGLGVLTLARTLRLGAYASFIAATCFELSPYILAQAYEGHYPHVWAASWYPWAFLGMLRLRHGGLREGWFLPLALAAPLLCGHPQEWCYLVVALGLWTLAWAAIDWSEGRRRVAVFGLGASGIAVGLAIGLAAVEWLPCAMVEPWTLRRSRLTIEGAGRYHLLPLDLLRLLSPRALGGPADYVGYGNFWETQLAIGWVPLTLAILALARWPRGAAVVGWGALAAGAIVFAAGRWLGLFALVYQVVPAMDRFRVPARSLFLASLAGAMLAGLGVEAASRPGDGPRALFRHHLRALVMIAAMLVIGQIVVVACGIEDLPVRPGVRIWRRWALSTSRLVRDPVFLGSLAATAAALGLLARRPDRRRVAALALGAVAIAELAASGLVLFQTTPAGHVLRPDPIVAAIDRLSPPGSFRIRARDAYFDDLAAFRHGLEKANANDSFQLQHAADLYEPTYSLFTPLRPRCGEPAAILQGVLDRLNVAFLITDRPLPEDAPWPVVATGTRDGSPFTIYRNPTAMPRAYVVGRAELAPDDADMVKRFADVDPRAAVLLPADPLAHLTGPRQPFTPASYDASDPDRLLIRVTTTAPGLLVVADTWMPGWSALLDGRPAPILRGNHAQRVVTLPDPGSHTILMRYDPPGLALGLTITAISALMVVGIHHRGHGGHGEEEENSRSSRFSTRLPLRALRGLCGESSG